MPTLSTVSLRVWRSSSSKCCHRILTQSTTSVHKPSLLHTHSDANLTKTNSYVGQSYRYIQHCQYHSKHWVSPKQEKDIKKCLVLLELDPSDYTVHNVTAVKASYVRLVKKYHPDKLAALEDSERTTGTEKFHEITQAHEKLLEFYQRQAEKENIHVVKKEEDKRESAIKAQYREYLDLEGVGYGSPFQRRKQYDSWRADKAAERVFEFRQDKMMRNTDDKALVQQDNERKYVRKIKTSSMLERMAEDMIAESMAKGDFDNLPGLGKPLKSSADHNPYVDSTTQRLNSVLINAGYSPQWMTLGSEIKASYKKLKDDLIHTYTEHGLSSPVWQNRYQNFKEEIKLLNKKVDTLNMIAPSLNLQMVHYRPELTLDSISSKAKKDQPQSNSNADPNVESKTP